MIYCSTYNSEKWEPLIYKACFMFDDANCFDDRILCLVEKAASVDEGIGSKEHSDTVTKSDEDNCKMGGGDSTNSSSPRSGSN